MCWTARGPKFRKELTAFNDMTVYKILRVERKRFGRTRFEPPIQEFTWKPGKTYHTKLGRTDAFLVTEINEGFHCFETMEAAGRYAACLSGGICIASATIPRGSRYYLNERHEIVTESLRIL